MEDQTIEDQLLELYDRVRGLEEMVAYIVRSSEAVAAQAERDACTRKPSMRRFFPWLRGTS